MLKKLSAHWKYPAILILGVGVSNIGAWVYLLSLNLMLFQLTASPLSIVFLYILGPLAALITNPWAGSLIDRSSKRNLMIYLDIARALFILVIPFLSSLPLIYTIAFVINMASAIFEPASMVYVTKLIPSEKRRMFNSLYNLMTSGAFLIGPAIAGLLFLTASPSSALFVTAAAFTLSAGFTALMPNLERNLAEDTLSSPLNLKEIQKDWRHVFSFSKDNFPVMAVYLLFSGVMVVIATAVDSLEVSFAKEVLQLSDSKYGVLVSIAGAGILIGSLLNTFMTKLFSIFTLLSGGAVFVAAGYVVFSFSTTFSMAAFGCFTLAFFISFANTGYLTFYQTYIPVEVMGRVGSIYGLIEAVLIIAFTLLLGGLTLFLSVQAVVRIGTLIMMAGAVLLFLYVRRSAFSETKPSQEAEIRSIS
ncbi:MFS transporter [Jeotgalibacillus proteolyticus]|uniref:MFS transporter n=1 Tax=Jeotgalibacillus proteolyticus TaxID=2082395 RepID=A0A2S5G9Z7_9BACL|nr:MFS transporter [Jeotgalibacillus proteolyticus]PPA69847.1 MFS transporter [Jeotgalibacillus proteolyticus]